MPKLNHEITLTQEFCWRNRWLMAKLTPQQRKMFFSVFSSIDPNRKYEKGQIVDVPREIMIAFLQCKPDISTDKLNENIREGFRAIKSFAEGTHIPYTYLGIKKGNYCFRLEDCSIFSNRGSKPKCTFNLNEISSYQDGRKRDNKTLPWLWYLQCIIVKFLFDFDDAITNTAYPIVQIQNDENGIPDKMYITFNHDDVKSVLGYGKYNYYNIPMSRNRETGEYESSREFYLDYIAFEKATYAERTILKKVPNKDDKKATKQREWAIQSLREAEKKLVAKYKMSLTTLEARYNQLKETSHRRVQLFLDKVLKPATTEINAGTMIRFCEMRNLRKPRKRTREEIAAGIPVGVAKEEMSFIRNNYEKKDSDHCISSVVGRDEYGNFLEEVTDYSQINDYKLRKWGQEYTVCVDLSQWKEKLQNADTTKKATNGSKKIEHSSRQEVTSASVIENNEDEDLPFTVGKPYTNTISQHWPWWDNDDDDLPFY